MMHFGSVPNGCRLVQEILQLFGIGALVLSLISLDVSGDGQIDMFCIVVPIKRDATKQSTFSVNCDFVVLFQ